jgi:hypothetical protein
VVVVLGDVPIEPQLIGRGLALGIAQLDRLLDVLVAPATERLAVLLVVDERIIAVVGIDVVDQLGGGRAAVSLAADTERGDDAGAEPAPSGGLQLAVAAALGKVALALLLGLLPRAEVPRTEDGR